MAWSLSGILAGAMSGAGKAIVDLADDEIKRQDRAVEQARLLENQKQLAEHQADLAVSRTQRIEDMREAKANRERETFGAASEAAWRSVRDENPKLKLHTSEAHYLYANQLAAAGFKDAAEKARNKAVELAKIESGEKRADAQIAAQFAAVRESRDARNENRIAENARKQEELLMKQFESMGTVMTVGPTGQKDQKDNTIAAGMFGYYKRAIADGAKPEDAFYNAMAIGQKARHEFGVAGGKLTPEGAWSASYGLAMDQLKPKGETAQPASALPAAQSPIPAPSVKPRKAGDTEFVPAASSASGGSRKIDLGFDIDGGAIRDWGRGILGISPDA